MSTAVCQIQSTPESRAQTRVFYVVGTTEPGDAGVGSHQQSTAKSGVQGEPVKSCRRWLGEKATEVPNCPGVVGSRPPKITG